MLSNHNASSQRNQTKPLLVWMPPFIWALLILIISILPYNGRTPYSIKHFDKLIHFLEYTILAILMVRSMYLAKVFWAKNLVFALILGMGYGIVMELLQVFIPNRAASLDDIIADAVGIAFGMVLGKLLLWRK